MNLIPRRPSSGASLAAELESLLAEGTLTGERRFLAEAVAASPSAAELAGSGRLLAALEAVAAIVPPRAGSAPLP